MTSCRRASAATSRSNGPSWRHGGGAPPDLRGAGRPAPRTGSGRESSGSSPTTPRTVSRPSSCAWATATTRRPTAACGASSGVSSTEGSACSRGPRHAATWAPRSGASRGVSSRPASAASGTRLMVSLPSLMARPSTASGSGLSTRRRPSWSVSERGVMSWSGC
ncbi:hypothetical protein GQ55_8G184700 [Panicum hallii var. hallii]|uniref:Uncharacterized protein n=1 Tax=Panicum hallii var. hallii TaxID=1504633 RepID=A0A2T7CP16_9POAL|nr:hypothetical protein GQ55_8G184700 [Panicum hallii var. hallii]